MVAGVSLIWNIHAFKKSGVFPVVKNSLEFYGVSDSGYSLGVTSYKERDWGNKIKGWEAEMSGQTGKVIKITVYNRGRQPLQVVKITLMTTRVALPLMTWRSPDVTLVKRIPREHEGGVPARRDRTYMNRAELDCFDDPVPIGAGERHSWNWSFHEILNTPPRDGTYSFLTTIELGDGSQVTSSKAGFIQDLRLDEHEGHGPPTATPS